MTDEKEKIHEEHKSQIFRSKLFDDYSTDEIIALCDELFEAHEKAGYPIF